MSSLPDSVRPLLRVAMPVLALPLVSLVQAAETGHYGYGTEATQTQIAGWDIDVRPDGMGLPPGEGSVEDGEWLYEEKCASCHGSFGESVGGYPALAGGEGSLTDPRPKKTVGSYWAYTSTLWDYIHRAMPFTQPESLTDDEVYAITAYVLHLNDIVDYDFVLTRDNLTDVHLPNAGNFIAEQRPDTNNKRCMKRCKDPAQIAIATEAPAFAGDDEAGESGETEDGLAVSAADSGIYDRHCALCHSAGIGGAPVSGEVDAWAARIGQGMDVLYRHAIEGYTGEDGVMPPKGGFMNLTDEEVQLAVDYIVEQSQ